MDAINESELFDGDYIVITDDYYVLITNGSLSNSYKTEPEMISNMEVSKQGSSYSRNEIPTDLSYFVLNSSGELVTTYYYKKQVV